jgi:Outer membrane protein beta-barrel domain
MNKHFLVIILVSTGFIAKAQFFIPHLGGTLNHSTQSFTNTSTGEVYHAKQNAGFMAGFGFNLKLGERMSFQPEIYYMQRNFKFNYKDSVTHATTGTNPQYTTSSTSDSYKIGYLEIPLLLKYKFLKEKMFFSFGPYVSIGLGGAHSYAYSTSTSGDITSSSGHDRITFGPAASGQKTHKSIDRRGDVGIQPGLGVVVLKKFTVEARWDIGKDNILKYRSSRNETLMLMISYPISLIPVDE